MPRDFRVGSPYGFIPSKGLHRYKYLLLSVYKSIMLFTYKYIWLDVFKYIMRYLMLCNSMY